MTWPDGNKACLKVSGARWRTESPVSQEMFDNLLAALGAVDECWTKCATAGVESYLAVMSNTLGVGASDWVCEGGAWWPAGLVFGSSYKQIASFNDIADAYGTGNGYWTSLLYTCWEELANGHLEYTTAADYELDCDGNTRMFSDERWFDEYIIIIYPGTWQPSTGLNYFGTGYNEDDASYNATSKFNALRLVPEAMLGRLAGAPGAEIAEALAAIRFDGLTIRTWTVTYNEDGSIVYDYADTTAGAIHYALFAVRKKSQNVKYYNGNTAPDMIAAHEYKSLGVSIEASVEDGKWVVCDLTDVIQAMLEDYDSANTEYLLVPSVGQPPPGTELSGMRSYLLSLLPSVDMEIYWYDEGNPSGCREVGTVSGRIVYFNQMRIGDVYCRHRVGAANADRALMRPRPPRIAGGG